MYFEDDKNSKQGQEVIVESVSNSERGDNGHRDQAYHDDYVDPNTSGAYSVVAMTSNRKKLTLAALVAFIIAVLYFAFFTGGSKNEPSQRDIAQRQERVLNSAIPVTGTTSDNSAIVSAAPAVQEPPALQAPQPPRPPLPPEPDIPQAPFLQGSTTPAVDLGGRGRIFGSDQESIEAQQRLQARRAEAIMVFGGGQNLGIDEASRAKGENGEGTGTEKDQAPPRSRAGFLGFGEGQLSGKVFGATAAKQVEASMIGQTQDMIAQGKMIDAVLETAINTDIPGMLRAIVARDVYAESGKRILIPKGTRAIGEYESEVKNGQTRVNVIWNRLILPNGVDVAIDSPGVDALGRAGVQGELNTKFWTRMLSAFLVSFIIPYAAFELSNAPNAPSTETTAISPDGTVITSSTSDIKSQLARDGAQRFSDIATEIVESMLPEKPTIHINQGSKVRIFVNKDVIFPPESVLARSRAIR